VYLVCQETKAIMAVVVVRAHDTTRACVATVPMVHTDSLRNSWTSQCVEYMTMKSAQVFVFVLLATVLAAGVVADYPVPISRCL
jgi:hypothetical protein